MWWIRPVESRTLAVKIRDFGRKTMNTKLIIAILAAFLLLGATMAWPQAGTVPIKGQVKGLDGKPMAGVTVEFVSLAVGKKTTLKTGKDGKYLTLGMLTGDYLVTLSQDGKQIEQDKVTIDIDESKDEFIFDLAKSQAAAVNKLGAEEQAKRDAALKENQKIQGLNKLLGDAQTANKAGNYEEAIRLMTEATQADATRDLLWANLGNSYLAAGLHSNDKAAQANDFQQAATALKKAVDLKPTAGDYHNNLGEAYAKLGKTQDAMQEYQAAAQNDPTNAAKYYFNLGAILTNTSHPDEANQAFDKAIAAKPDYAEAYYQKAVNLLNKATVDEKTGSVIAPPEAATDLNKYLELAPTGANAQNAKDLLASLGSKVETSYGKTKKK
jgi:tetratricopeptide (TPR) repeat protein